MIQRITISLGLLALVIGSTFGASAPEKAAALPPLPKAVSSLGAIEANGYLYVYGGHAGKTHTYSTSDVIVRSIV